MAVNLTNFPWISKPLAPAQDSLTPRQPHTLPLAKMNGRGVGLLTCATEKKGLGRAERLGRGWEDQIFDLNVCHALQQTHLSVRCNGSFRREKKIVLLLIDRFTGTAERDFRGFGFCSGKRIRETSGGNCPSRCENEAFFFFFF